jgi:signal transduction histidine kinase
MGVFAPAGQAAALRRQSGAPMPAPAAATAASPPPPPGPEALPALQPGELEPDQVRRMYTQYPVVLAGYFAGALILVLLFHSVAPTAVLTWFGAFVVILLARLETLRRFHKTKSLPRTAAAYRRWTTLWTAGTIASGVAWGVAVWLFYGRGDTLSQVGLILIVYSFCVVAIPLLSSQYRIFVTFVVLCFVPMVLRVATDPSPQGLALAGVILVIFGMTVLMGTYFRVASDRIIEFKVRTEHLAEQLQREKAAAEEARAVAEAARQAAETANRGKTQFFSAASHDLRQPLHAMVLFAEALRQKNRDPDVAQLINSINGSVDALEGLFSELLDITRIDSGGIDVTPQHVGLRDLFARLKLHFEPTAFEKGLALQMHGGHHHVYADPVLVERILRNLVSNAIRYTEDGGVLVSCRKRGARMCLQVWDTGIGIAEQTLPRIFDEFYQVQGGRRLEAHHRKGLGLGLAIVKRLADLMQAPLTVRSVPGRGTVFTLLLPHGRVQVRDEREAAVRLRPAPALTLGGKRIVIVEDEPAVLDGLQVLLRSWGAEVQGFETVEAAEQWLATRPEAPDLLVVDFRLPEGRTGVDAILALRQGFGLPQLPAIVVTGSALSGHEIDAQQHNFHLMFKPVVPTKLRAMIAFKLGMR